MNALVPSDAPTGDAIPVTVSVGGVASNAVQIAVQPPSPDQRADQLLTQMTQDQKIQLVYGAVGAATASTTRGGAGWVPGIPALGIPDLYLADGSVGVGNGVGQATALPSSIASAASWDLNRSYPVRQRHRRRAARLRHERELGRQHQLDRPRAARRPHLRNQRRRSPSWPARSPPRTSTPFRPST